MSLELYVRQLVEDLQALTKPEQTWQELFGNNDKNPESIGELFPQDSEETKETEYDFEDVERYLSGDFEVSISSICKLEKEHFPAPELLTDKQIELINMAFIKLMQSNNISFDFPEKLPEIVKYDLIRNGLEEKVYCSKDGFTTVEFCSYEKEECLYAKAGFCDCKDYLI
jgi:hypothetical protein